VSKFPTTISANNNIKAAHNATPSALEGTLLDETVAFPELAFGATTEIFILNFTEWVGRRVSFAD